MVSEYIVNTAMFKHHYKRNSGNNLCDLRVNCLVLINWLSCEVNLCLSKWWFIIWLECREHTASPCTATRFCNVRWICHWQTWLWPGLLSASNWSYHGTCGVSHDTSLQTEKRNDEGWKLLIMKFKIWKRGEKKIARGKGGGGDDGEWWRSHKKYCARMRSSWVMWWGGGEGNEGRRRREVWTELNVKSSSQFLHLSPSCGS